MLLLNLPLVLSLFSLPASDAGAAAAPAAKTQAVDHGARGDRGHADLCATLACTDAQRTTITKALTDMRTKMKALGGKGDRGAALAKAMADGKLDRTEVLAALRSDDGDRAKREGIMADTIVAIHGALDSSQRTKLTDLVKTRGAKAVVGGHGKGGHGKSGKGKGKPGGAKGKSAHAGRRPLSRKPA